MGANRKGISDSSAARRWRDDLKAAAMDKHGMISCQCGCNSKFEADEIQVHHDPSWAEVRKSVENLPGFAELTDGEKRRRLIEAYMGKASLVSADCHARLEAGDAITPDEAAQVCSLIDGAAQSRILERQHSGRFPLRRNAGKQL